MIRRIHIVYCETAIFSSSYVYTYIYIYTLKRQARDQALHEDNFYNKGNKFPLQLSWQMKKSTATTGAPLQSKMFGVYCRVGLESDLCRGYELCCFEKHLKIDDINETSL